MERINLIQHGDLTKTIAMPISRITSIGCNDLFVLSKKICETNGYCGLAMNQIPLDLIKEHTGYKSHHRMMFLMPETHGGGESSVTEDTLIINPKIELRIGYDYLSLEGCGSIDFGRTLMLVRRPTDFKLSGLFYMSGMGLPEYEEVESKNLQYFNASQHEVDHLDGYTALNFLGTLVNPLDETGPIVDCEQLAEMLKDEGKGLIIYTGDRLEKISYQDLIER